MLEDEKLSKHHNTNYIACNFIVIRNKSKNNRIWERPDPKDIIIEANQDGQLPPQREITQCVTLKRFEGKNYGYYVIVPNIMEPKKDIKTTFFLRLFASEPVYI